jgi:hypothetical protein
LGNAENADCNRRRADRTELDTRKIMNRSYYIQQSTDFSKAC